LARMLFQKTWYTVNSLQIINIGNANYENKKRTELLTEQMQKQTKYPHAHIGKTAK